MLSAQWSHGHSHMHEQVLQFNKPLTHVWVLELCAELLQTPEQQFRAWEQGALRYLSTLEPPESLALRWHLWFALSTKLGNPETPKRRQTSISIGDLSLERYWSRCLPAISGLPVRLKWQSRDCGETPNSGGMKEVCLTTHLHTHSNLWMSCCVV